MFQFSFFTNSSFLLVSELRLEDDGFDDDEVSRLFTLLALLLSKEVDLLLFIELPVKP